MPWTIGDAMRHTKKATSPAKKKQWVATANAVLQKSGDDGKAVRIANSAVKTPKPKPSPKPKRTRKC